MLDNHMDKITDKYHQAIQPDSKHLNPLFDIKEVPKRTYQLGLAAMFTGIGLSVYDAGIGMYVSSFLVACFCFSILMFMLLKYNGDIKDLTISIISMICALLVFSAMLEGLQSDQYLYFFPVLIAVPLIVDLKQTKYRKSLTFVSIIIFSFILCICIGRYVKPMESFTLSQISKLALINRIVAIFTTIVLAALYTFFEKKYIDELVEQSIKVIDTKTQFLATMGHELRTPLNGIIGVVNLLKDETDAAKKEEYIKILQYCSNNMLQQVNDILDFNKIEGGKLEIHYTEVNLYKLITNVALPFIVLADDKGIDIIMDIDSALDIWVLADSQLLIQVFSSLFTNALKFTSKGFIRLEAICIKKTESTIIVSFSIKDTGAGIDKEDQAKIFESFWQVYDENTNELTGTGLGLTISMRLLKLIGGTLVLDSVKGAGSTFSFNLTFTCTSPILTAETETPRDLSGVNVLLVEDNQINMMVAKKILSGFNAAVSTASDGKQALEKLAGNAGFNMVLMDLEMPVMNGYEAIYKVKDLYPNTPVLALTASLVDEQMLNDLIASGFSDCMLKPFEPQQLLALIRKYL